MNNFKRWLHINESQEQINAVKSDIIKLLAGAGTSEGDALKINLAKKVKGQEAGVKKGVKAIEAILADNNIFNRLRQISPETENNLRNSLSRARPDYYELATLLKDTFGDPTSPKINPREKPKLPTMPPKDSNVKMPKPMDSKQLPPPSGQPDNLMMNMPNPPMY